MIFQDYLEISLTFTAGVSELEIESSKTGPGAKEAG